MCYFVEKNRGGIRFWMGVLNVLFYVWFVIFWCLVWGDC